MDTPVKDFTTGAINKKKIEHVKRFHDTYHNEAVIGKIGFVDKKWADRLMFGFTYSHMYKDIQTGVRKKWCLAANIGRDTRSCRRWTIASVISSLGAWMWY